MHLKYRRIVFMIWFGLKLSHDKFWQHYDCWTFGVEIFNAVIVQVQFSQYQNINLIQQIVDMYWGRIVTQLFL